MLKARAIARAAQLASETLLSQARAEVDARRPAGRFDAIAAVASQLPLKPGATLMLTAEAGDRRGDAARHCIHLLIGPYALYRRFPKALSGGAGGQFAAWLREDASPELGLPDDTIAEILSLFEEAYGQRARNFFVGHPEARDVLPHGLLAGGHPILFQWFMDYACKVGGIEVEEACWLFLEAAEDPLREVMLGFLFTPKWQHQHPEGLGIFGRRNFAAWLAESYGFSGKWLDTETWPDWQDAADQIRIGYHSRPDWRAAHPTAVSSTQEEAGRLLEWLTSSDLGLPAEVRAWLRRQDKDLVSSSLAKAGINVIGHFCYPSGLRVSVQSLVAAFSCAGVRSALRDIRTDLADDPGHFNHRGTEVFDITLIHTQPQPFFKEAYARADLMPRGKRTYRVAYWYWEFDSIPQSWLESARDVDEVWTATEFVAKGLRERLSIPVHTLFPGVALAPYRQRRKREFGLAESDFCFLFTFHMMSIMERKNPLGLIQAFKLAFRPEEGVSLVLKTSFGSRHPELLAELLSAAQGSNIRIIDQIYSPDEVLSLMDACDAYVSLHRSEGLGLTMAEAMLMGKPVIATGYSGNVDFMNAGNSLLVDHTLVRLERAIPPYEEGLSWAEPSVDHAAALMRKIFENRVWAKELGVKAQRDALQMLSLEAAGKRLAARLSQIARPSMAKVATTR